MLLVDVVAVALESSKGLAFAAATVPCLLCVTFQVSDPGENAQDRPSIRRRIKRFLDCSRLLGIALRLSQARCVNMTCLHLVHQQSSEIAENFYFFSAARICDLKQF